MQYSVFRFHVISPLEFIDLIDRSNEGVVIFNFSAKHMTNIESYEAFRVGKKVIREV